MRTQICGSLLLVAIACGGGEEGDAAPEANTGTDAASGSDGGEASGSGGSANIDDTAADESGTADTDAETDGGGSDGGEPSAQELYLTLCASCHGVEGEGTAFGYPLQHSPPGYSTWVVRNGRPGVEFPDAQMMAHGEELVSDAQLDEIFAWLDSFPQPVGGEALYADYCANCHGEPNVGGVVGVDLLDEEPGDILDKVREGEGGINYADRDAYMPSWGADKLSDDEVQAIVDWYATL